MKCGQTKSIVDFYFYNSTMRHSSRCKECLRAQCREYRRTPGYKKSPRTKEQRRKEYISRCIKLGSQTRFALKSLFEDPINGLRKCTKCKQYKSSFDFWRDNRHKSGYRSKCKTCSTVKKKSIQARKYRFRKEVKLRVKIRGFLKIYLSGNGCCLYCGETHPFFLNNHHPFGRKNSDFVVTLCENHHAPFTRGTPFVLQSWY